MGVVLGMMLATVLLVGVGERFSRPYPVLVLLVGVLLALLPGIPRLHIDPSLILPLFLPPLIFSAAQRTSWRRLWELRRSIIALSLVLVLVTIVAVAFVARAVVAGVSVAAAIALGALAAPPDPVAAEAVAGPIGLPRRLITLLQAEGLCNDATALVVYGLAVQYITGKHLAAWEVAPRFLYEAIVGSALGVAVAWISGRLRGFIGEATARSGLTLIVPFVCYLVASAVDASGVLAVLAAALFLGRSGDDDAGVADRLSGGAFWDTLEMLITGVAFGLIGLELREVLDTGVDVAGAVLPALAISAVIVGVRVVWMLVGGPLVRHSPLLRTETAHNSREDLVLAWCGMRGLATIALALALPSDTPDRAELLLITFGVIVVTLVLPGLTLPWLVTRLGVRADPDLWDASVHALARRAGKAALSRLRELDVADDLPAEAGDILRRRQQGMIVMLGGTPGAEEDPDYRQRLQSRLQMINQVDDVYAQMLAAARGAVLAARTEPGMDPAAADEVLRKLDLRSAHLLLRQSAVAFTIVGGTVNRIVTKDANLPCKSRDAAVCRTPSVQLGSSLSQLV
jgi:Na+/H+ antiporter